MVGQDRADVVNRVEDVGALFSTPAIWTREAAIARGMVAVAVDEVQRRRPMCVKTDLVRPGGHGRKVAGRGALPLVILGVFSEDRADGLEDLRVEVGLGDYGNNFMAWVLVSDVWFNMRIGNGMGGNAPAAPQANAWGRLPRPIIAATMNPRMA